MNGRLFVKRSDPILARGFPTNEPLRQVFGQRYGVHDSNPGWSTAVSLRLQIVVWTSTSLEEFAGIHPANSSSGFSQKMLKRVVPAHACILFFHYRYKYVHTRELSVSQLHVVVLSLVVPPRLLSKVGKEMQPLFTCGWQHASG